jgi:hypothetical protein
MLVAAIAEVARPVGIRAARPAIPIWKRIALSIVGEEGRALVHLGLALPRPRRGPTGGEGWVALAGRARAVNRRSLPGPRRRRNIESSPGRQTEDTAIPGGGSPIIRSEQPETFREPGYHVLTLERVGFGEDSRGQKRAVHGHGLVLRIDHPDTARPCRQVVPDLRMNGGGSVAGREHLDREIG